MNKCSRQELLHSLEGRYVYLQPWEFESDYYESEIAWYIESPEQLSVLENHLNSIISLTKIVADEPTKIDLFVMLHALKNQPIFSKSMSSTCLYISLVLFNL
jgi:hypothetical protein